MSFSRRTLLAASATGVGAVLLSACGSMHSAKAAGGSASSNIVQVAQSDPQFSILVEAVVKANLAGALSGTGPFTVFAPTNDAFAAALKELGVSKEQLLASPLLGDILKYHVLSGRVTKAQVPVGQAVATLQGATLTVGPDLMITDKLGRRAGIVKTDIMASNGVIHVIDKVILPRSL